MTAANFSALQHHYADGVTADGFLRLFAAKKPSLLKGGVNDSLSNTPNAAAKVSLGN